MVADPFYRKQYVELFKGFSLADTPDTGGGLTTNDIERYVDTCRRRSLKKQITRLSGKLNDLSQPLDGLVASLTSTAYDLSYDEVRVMDSRHQMAMGTQYVLDRFQNQGTLPGLSFGPLFPQTDDILLGLKPGEIQVLAGTTGVGKSNLALDWAMAMSYKNDVPVLWVSLEMNEVTMALRIRSKLTGVSNKRMMRGNLEGSELMKISEAAVKYANKPLSIVTAGGMTVSQFIALVRKYRATKGIQAVFVDYLQLLTPDKTTDNLFSHIRYFPP
jgi:replicative DNA helicase